MISRGTIEMEDERRPALLSRLGWFVLLWLAGTGAIAVVAWLIRLWLL